MRAGLGSGRLIVITGPIGIGKTVFLHRLQDAIASEKKVTVAESLSVDTMRWIAMAVAGMVLGAADLRSSA